MGNSEFNKRLRERTGSDVGAWMKTPPPFELVTADIEHNTFLTAMAAVHLSKKAVTIPTTVRTLSSGVPVAPLVSLSVREPAGHGHGHEARSDVPARWATRVSWTSSGLISRSFVSGE